MARDLAEAFPEVRQLFEEADEVLGVFLSRLCWKGPEDELVATQNAQPAILLHSYAVWTLLRPRLEGRVAVAAGHSLGEFTAHLLAGTLRFDDALRLVRRRGELMGQSGDLRPGTMTAVIGLEPEEIEALCGEVASGVVVPANFNAPGQIVISGDVSAVHEAGELASARGAKRVLPLNVSGAFHSPLMEEVVEGLRDALAGTDLVDPGFPVVANATAATVGTAAEAKATLLAQLTSPVRWVESMTRMQRLEPVRWLELGPGRVLAGLMRRIDRSVSVQAVGAAASLDDVDGTQIPDERLAEGNGGPGGSQGEISCKSWKGK
jgi:[acyl-carrier-protein] S-malonyltransferase